MKINSLLIYIFLFIGSISSNGQISNTAFGNQAGANISTGDFMTLIGDSTGYNATTLSYGTFLGTKAGFNLTTSSDNTLLGAFAGFLSTTGIDNVMVGKFSGYHNTGSDNTFIGNEAGRFNTTGGDNTFIGENAGLRITTGHNNTFVGEKTGASTQSSSSTNIDPATGDDNTGIGTQALYRLTSGYQNTSLGNEAGYDITSGYRNTMVGDSCGTDIGTGHHNTMVGQAAGARSEHASYNTFIGWLSGYSNNLNANLNQANRNTYIGARTGYTNIEGEDNAGFGAFADFNSDKRFRTVFMGAYAQPQHDDVVSIGYSSRSSGQFGVAIGTEADVTATNAIAIGYQAVNAVENTAVIGNPNLTSIGGAVNWTATSDGRYKKEISEDVIGLDFIDQLRPVTYCYDLTKLISDFTSDSNVEINAQKESIRYSGFIAQEVEMVAKAVGYDFSGIDAPQNENDKYGLRYAEFTVPAVKAIQELHSKVKHLESVIELQEKQLAQVQQQFTAMENRLAKIERHSNDEEMNVEVENHTFTLQEQ